MFEERSKDFGSVPRGPLLSHSFRFTNKTQQPVHISGVRVSCGCVAASAAQDQVGPGQSSEIKATMDTRRFTGAKSVTIYVRFDQPQWEEVHLTVQANGRNDLTINPESMAFGRIKKGTASSASVNLTILGGSGWVVTDAQTESNYIKTSLKEVRRDSAEVSYQLTATIRADTPSGKWYSDIWVNTNDQSMPKIRVPLTVEIESPLTLSSSAVTLGEVQPGAEIERKVVLRGATPFKITRIEGADDRWSVRDSTSDSKPVHVLVVKLKSAQAGEIAKRFRIITDLEEDGEVEFMASAHVLAPQQ
jgi:hypothetical protein